MELTKAIDHVPNLAVLREAGFASLPSSPSFSVSREQHSVASVVSLLEDRIVALENLYATLSTRLPDHDTLSLASLHMVDNASVTALSD